MQISTGYALGGTMYYHQIYLKYEWIYNASIYTESGSVIGTGMWDPFVVREWFSEGFSFGVPSHITEFKNRLKWKLKDSFITA